MKKKKLELKKSTIRVLLDGSSLRRVVGGLSVFGCAGDLTITCPSCACSAACTVETEAPAAHCSGAECWHDTIQTLGP